jgi:hypothetical protein
MMKDLYDAMLLGTVVVVVLTCLYLTMEVRELRQIVDRHESQIQKGPQP